MKLQFSERYFDDTFGKLNEGCDRLAEAVGGSWDVSREIRYGISKLEEKVVKLESGYQIVVEDFEVEAASLLTDDALQIPYQGAAFLQRIQHELYDVKESYFFVTAVKKSMRLCPVSELLAISQSLLERRLLVKSKFELMYLEFKKLMDAHENLKNASTLPVTNSRQEKWRQVEEKHSQVTEGFVYVMRHPFMDGVVKIGFSARNPDARARELSTQIGLPASFAVCSYLRTRDPYIVEQRVLNALKDKCMGNEYFKISELDAAQIIQREAEGLALIISK